MEGWKWARLLFAEAGFEGEEEVLKIAGGEIGFGFGWVLAGDDGHDVVLAELAVGGLDKVPDEGAGDFAVFVGVVDLGGAGDAPGGLPDGLGLGGLASQAEEVGEDGSEI